jgi:phospholipid transport system substrate-binding protein
MKKLLALSFVVLSMLFAAIPFAYADNSNPTVMLESVADQVIASLKANKANLKTNPTLVYSLANKIIVPHADLTEMSQRVLPPHTWNSASVSQRNQFKQQFTSLLVRTYASALADYTDQTIRFYPIRGGYEGKDAIRVDSQIVRNDGPPVSVNYRLVLEGTDWKLYDLIVEGVSLLESFRSQFADKLAQGDMDDLIKQLKLHNSDNGNR